MEAKQADRIRKLLALAERGGTEAEMLAALGKAREIVAGYGMSLAEFEAQMGAECEADERITEGVAASKKERRELWTEMLLCALCKICDCQTVFIGGSFTRLNFGRKKNVVTDYICAGREDHLVTLKLMHESVAGFARQECAAQARRIPTQQRRQWRNSFYRGFARRVYARCTEMMVQEEDRANELRGLEGEECRALALAHDRSVARMEALQRYVSDRHKAESTGEAGRIGGGAIDGDGYHAWARADNEVELAARMRLEGAVS